MWALLNPICTVAVLTVLAMAGGKETAHDTRRSLLKGRKIRICANNTRKRETGTLERNGAFVNVEGNVRAT